MPRVPSARPLPRRPLRGSAAAVRLPQRAMGRARAGRGARGRGRVRGRRTASASAPGALAAWTKCRERESGGGREGGSRRGRGYGPSGKWAGLSRRTPSGPYPAAPPPEQHPRHPHGRWRRGAPANRSLRLGAPRRRTARAAGSDGSGSCHVERERGGDCGGWGTITGSRIPVLGSRAGRYTSDL